MRRTLLVAACLALPLLGACDDEETGPDEERFTATLNGASEVPGRATPATGTAELTINEDRTISFRLNVSGINRVTMAHIHGPATTADNAGIIVWLFPPGATAPGAPTGTLNGQLAEGVIRSTNNSNVSLDSLTALIRNGRAYVNVHTNDNVQPADTGPGDFPGGEIRGQITRQ